VTAVNKTKVKKEKAIKKQVDNKKNIKE